MKLKCTFIEPLFAAAVAALYKIGRTYEARPVMNFPVEAVHVHSDSDGHSIVAMPVGEGFKIVAPGDLTIAKFSVEGKRRKQFHKRETNVKNWFYDQRRARRFARQVLKRPVTNPAMFSEGVHSIFKKLSRRH